MENNSEVKYQYHALVWGGFYNSEHQIIHEEKEGDYVFDTLSERDAYVEKLMEISRKLGTHLRCLVSEGYCCNVRTKGHRVVESDGKRYYSEHDFGVNYPFSTARYHMEEKWTCGFNDYPLGEDFDYKKNPPTIIAEWITGANQILEFV